ncbi:M23 family metallopeptidase [Flavobacteriaceae bacterium]|jgi:murein DD-endopeptidase MepM/ murein hydrolase activator NlpD|nr:M23 family metallopeptidase [Flavobacteriaceae bacterium]|tara:strand:- start:4690 stop:5544 length:855 start_codon:yes stop_codon:yes gene_type:complete
MNIKEKKPFSQRLLNKYRLVVLNEATYEERLSYKLSRLNIFLFFSLIAILIIISTICLIAFTSVKEYIPGYDSTVLRTNAVKNIETLDSLTLVIEKNQDFINSIGSVILGETTKSEAQKEIKVRIDISDIEFKVNQEDSLLRKVVEKEDRFNVLESATSKVKYVLISPIFGQVTSRFDYGIKHFGTDIAVPINSPVKSIAKGTVVLAEWTVQTGYVIVIEHAYGLTSVYKHNDSGLISQGDLVESGQVIALSGNTGELTTGPHLHFELWREGIPVNPENYVSFE